MSVESGGSLAVSGSPSSSLSVPASPNPSATLSVERSTAQGVAYGDTRVTVSNGRGGSPERAPETASALLRSVKQGVEHEEEARKRRGKVVGSIRRDKNGVKFLNANKQLMKKGILDLDSRDGFSTLPSSSSSSLTPRTSAISPRPVSLYANLPTTDRPSVATPEGVLVAGYGGSMRRVVRENSPTDFIPSQLGDSIPQAFSPDSGYGHTPADANKLHEPTQQRLQTGTSSAQATSASDSGVSSRSNSDRTNSSDSVRGTLACEETSAGFIHCGDMSMPRGGDGVVGGGGRGEPAIFTIGEAVTTVFPSPISPPPPSPSDNKPSSSSYSLATHSSNDFSSLPPTMSYPYSINSSLSPSPGGPQGKVQKFKFNPPPIAMTHGVSTPALSSLPQISQRNHTSRSNRTHYSHHYQPRRGDAPANHRRSATVNLRDTKARQTRSQSQPAVASLTINRPVVGSQVDSSAGGGGPKDYFQVTDELSRENSHFSLSEALITVVEQYKANTTEAFQEAVRAERATPISEDYRDTPQISSDLCATSPPPRSWGSISSIATEDSVDGFSLKKSSPQISLASLMTSATTSESVQSAEYTSQRLIQFIATQYSGVDAEDMENSSSNSGTSTELMLPLDFLRSLNQDEDLQASVTMSRIPTVGTKDWAPPRAQIIFHIKTPPVGKNVMKVLAAQGYRCTGCGLRQDPAHEARHFRFCHYTGRLFCQKCHTNATSIIPAHVIHRWSFKKLYVSNFAHDLLERIHYEPVFDLQTVNSKIYSIVPQLSQARDLRTQLVAVKKYLKTCRLAQSLMATFDGYIPWTVDVHTYSIEDFIQIKLKIRYLRSLLQDSIRHVKSCPLCQGKGFVCEFCNSPEIIFPFELTKVAKCPQCQCCFHKQCFSNQSCPRCIRIRQRERSRRRTDSTDEDLHTT